MELGETMEGTNLGVEFNMKIAASDGRKYLVSEAEEKDLKRMIESSCMHCNRLMARDEIKVVPPQSIQEQDRYVSSGAVARRVLCTQCYERMTSSTRERVRMRYRQIGRSLRSRLFRALANGTAGR
ncbi:MAG: hypothetical protein KGH53_00465 [Candidatus Micrarchaeota archaeon]|nr:hypothetical protein [Candidatus Micrarchaeota archaeon]